MRNIFASRSASNATGKSLAQTFKTAVPAEAAFLSRAVMKNAVAASRTTPGARARE